MKIKESPSIILAFHGMLGRKKQTSLLLLLLTLVFSFLTAAVIYSVSSAQVLQDTRCELYGEWQYLRLSDTAADAAQAQNTLPASAQVSTVIQNGIVLGADDCVAGGIGTVDDTFAQLGRIVPISGDFPTQSDEIAMTTTLLDALGCRPWRQGSVRAEQPPRCQSGGVPAAGLKIDRNPCFSRPDFLYFEQRSFFWCKTQEESWLKFQVC